ncbi:MAG TPA: type II toxin-antitoxin system RelE/ParE family toxin [Anaerolineae bacterium]|nr:type II toxin-antitoxin system RelE/ParE family toxin [Anaerolineae bacterium]
MRVGSYRILYRVDDVARIVIIYRVRHRRDAYK